MEPDTARAAQVEAFAQATLSLAGQAWSQSARLAVAVSGGGDSLALMALAAEAFPGRVHALSFDHRLRAESAAECVMVATLAEQLGIPHTTLHSETPLDAANVQANARAARYAAMEAWCAANTVAFLLTAHHADDQAETLLLRLARGSGLAGLSGIRSTRALDGGVTLLRPLLGWRHDSLVAIARARGWRPIDDPSNRNPRFDRVHARALLADAPWLDPERLADSAQHLAHAEAALCWATDRAWASRATVSNSVLTLDLEALPCELQRRLLLRGLAHFGVAEPDGPAVARLAERLRAGGSGTLGGARAKALASSRWQLSAAPARRTSG